MASTTIVLPAPVSPVTTVMPGPSTSRSSAITPEVADRQLYQHAPATLPLAPGHRSLSPNLVFRMRRKLRGPKVTKRAGDRRRGAGDGVAPAEGAQVVAVDRQGGRAVAHHLDAHGASGASTSDRSKSMCGETGVISRQRWVGSTIGPRAEKA